MKFSNYLGTYNGMKTEGRFLRLTCAVLACTTCFLVVTLASRPTIVTITPWTLNEDAQVTRNDASRSYIESWGFALAELLGNVTPANVDFISDRIRPLLSPRIYHATLEGLIANAKQLQEERITMRFEPRRVTYEKTTGKVFVNGYSFVRLGSAFETERREERTYEFGIRIANYAPMIVSIDTYEGTARTQAEIARSKKAEAVKKAKEAKRNAAERNRNAGDGPVPGISSESDQKL